jgi:hypothetical protein
MSRKAIGQATFCGLLIAAAGLLAQSEAPPADETTSSDSTSNDKDRARRLRHMMTAATDFDLSTGADGDQKLKLIERPVLRWSNPERATDDGAVFLWTEKDRPAAALCIYPAGVDGLTYEWQSLSAGSLRATDRQRTVWQPQTAGLEFRPVPGDAEPAAATPARRLNQMHRLLRDFTAEFIRRDSQRHELRALTQPIYRYGGHDTEVVDGTLFAFAQATDPEVFLLLEARTQNGRPPTWWWAAARMSTLLLEVKYRGELVWTAERCWEQRRDDRQPYTMFERRWIEGK